MLAAVVTIHVLSLFQPKQVILHPTKTAQLTVHSQSTVQTLKPGQTFMFAASSGVQVEVTSPAPIEIELPGRLKRTYPSAIKLRTARSILEITIAVDLETAVAWAVQAESMPGSKLEARKALAVAARSWFLSAGPRHSSADVCDTTHCQFLGSPHQLTSQTIAAVKSSQGLVLLFDGKLVEAMHSADCGGRTLALSEVGLVPSNYTFVSVDCPVTGPKWLRKLAPEDLALLAPKIHNETARLELTRRLGWSFLPSNNYQIEGDSVIGVGRGHGVGLCQTGAMALAEKGLGFLAILRHYFPNTLVSTMR